MKVKNKIEYGKVEVTKDLEQVPKIRTTMFLDIDLKDMLKEESTNKGIKYQQLIREILYKHFDEKESFEDRIKKLEEIVLKEA